jgi:alpha-glucosidase
MKNIFLLKNLIILVIYCPLLTAISCSDPEESVRITSPNGKLAIQLKESKGNLYYCAEKEGNPILVDSRLGFTLSGGEAIMNNLEIVRSDSADLDETWEQPWGESRLVRNNYRELKVFLQEKSGLKRSLYIVFRVFDDGFGFRYEFPVQPNLKKFQIARENTEFRFAAPLKAWWIPAYKEVYYESLARYSRIAEMDTVCTPLTLETGDGRFLAIHEANLTNYAKMNLYPTDSLTLSTDLTPWSNGVKVYAETPCVTPWRTMIIAENINELVTSNIMLNLNEPSRIADLSWIRPGKYIGIWWSIHLGKYTWCSGERHGATTANTKAYIDFAAASGFSGVLAEGWNVGWDGDWTKNGETLDFTKAYPDFDIQLITDYAASKGVELIGHHETAGMATHYENQLDSAYTYYQKYNVHVVKTGYVNPRLNNKEFHDGQYAVNHYRKVVETAAKYHIMIDNHEPVMPTGIQRTWPNLMTQEAVRGQEYDAWSPDGGNPPDHTTIVPFLRCLAGPTDFTPGTFNFENPSMPNTRVRTTLAKQLALYVVIYSPLQMASDAPENYKGVKAFDFIKSVPVSWEKTLVPDARIGDYAIFARKNRNSENWFMGCITDENARELNINLSFLDKGATYIARIYSDGEDADWNSNPNSMIYQETEVNSSKIIPVTLAPGGGCAIELVKKK